MKTLLGSRIIVSRHAPFSKEQGASLLISLVALIIVTLAGLALIRSIDTATLVAGNYAFKSGTQNIADVAIEEARAYLETIVTAGNAANANLPGGCAAATSSASLGTCRYYARQQNENANGVPFINWGSANIPIYTSAAAPPGGWPAATIPTGYQIQFVVERLCTPDTSVAVNLPARPRLNQTGTICMTELPAPQASNKAGTPPPASPIVYVHYRITTRVSGPKNTETITQTIMHR